MARLRRFYAWLQSPRVICGWCPRRIEFGGPFYFFMRGRRPSHGMCDACCARERAAARQMQGKVAMAEPVLPPRAALTLAARLSFFCAAVLALNCGGCEPVEARRVYRPTVHQAIALEVDASSGAITSVAGMVEVQP